MAMNKMGKIAMRPLQRKRKYYGYGNEKHRVLNFKQFVSLKDDEISPEKAAEEYSEYLYEFLNNEITLYYDKYEHRTFFREKFHPYYLREDYLVTKNAFLARSSQFIADYESGKYKDLLLEISFKRLYGVSRISDEFQNSSDVSYTYNDWAYEIPLEYPKDDSLCNRLPLTTPLNSVLLVDVPERVFKFEVINAVKHRVGDSIFYVAEKDDLVRTVFVTVPENENIKKLCDDLNMDHLTVQDFLLRFEPCNPPKERCIMRICPPICSHPIVIMRDLTLTGKLIKKLDAELGRTDNTLVDLLPEDLDIKFRLDLYLIYLRMVHSYCYYGRIKAQNYIELWDMGGAGHVRVDLTNELFDNEDGLTSDNVNVKFASWDNSKDIISNDKDHLNNQANDWEEELTSAFKVSYAQIQWLKDVESFALHILNSDLAPPQYVEDSQLIEERWKQFCNLNSVIDGPERFRCKLCKKLFNDPKFVWKHLKLKHSDSYDKIVVECGLPQMRELFFNAHRDTKCNPFERLVSIPVLQKPVSDFDTTTSDFYKRVGDQFNRMGNSNKRKRREYYDFDKPQVKRDQIVTFANDEYCRPSVKYDDL